MIIALIGLALSAYLTYVKLGYSKKPFCDLSKNVSCTAVLKSKYSQHLGIPNTIIGMIYYLLILLLELLGTPLLLWFTFIGVLANIYLAYRMMQLKKICIVCVLTYVVNALLFFEAVLYLL